jgi:pyruvate,water dikinase
VPLRHMVDYLRALEAGESIARPRDQVLAERDRITAEYRGLIPNPQDAAAFDGLVGLTRMVAPASEDHSIYQGSWFHSLYSRKIRGVGSLLERHGILEEPEDVFMLNRQELDSVVWEMYTSWARGVEPVARYHWPERIQRRKEILERLRGWSPPPALGTVPEVITSPVSVVLFGVTPELVEAWWEAGQEDAGRQDRLVGLSGSAGVVEGVARLCRSVHDLADLQAGEIMVTPSTAPTWAPAFQLAAGVVTDMGGIFCHTAIVAREYGLPAVVGTGYATGRIRNGDRIRVDADAGLVEVLERSA